MAKYSIEHICGHTETVQIYGTNVHSERERKAEWLASRPCKDCEREQLREENLAGCSELEGTEKQIAWANDIRAKAIAEVKNMIASVDGRHPNLPQSSKGMYRHYGELVIKAMLSERSARDIIDHRDAMALYYSGVASRDEGTTTE